MGREVRAGHSAVVVAQATCSESQRNAARKSRFRGLDLSTSSAQHSFLIFWGGAGTTSRKTSPLARLRSAPRLCTQTSPRRWAARAGAGVSLLGIVFARL